ncbi:MAG TPA: hypothetical protein VF734_19355, partial [Pseudonocardiaceae bacterium]
YRDTCRLLLAFAWRATGIQPTRLDLSHLDAPLIAAFSAASGDRAGQHRRHPQRPAGRPCTPCSATPPYGHLTTPS